MDRSDENFLERTDWNTYNEEVEQERCSYCGKEEDECEDGLNVVHYEFDPRATYDENVAYDFKIVAVNPMPHDKISLRKGYKRKTELLCDSCLRDEFNYKEC